MNIKLHTVALFFAAAIYGYGQDPRADSSKIEIDRSTHPKKISRRDAPSAIKNGIGESEIPNKLIIDYVRPSAKKRFKHYANNVVGPLAFVRYGVVAGLLTWRNSPTEWENKWGGFGRRAGNQFAKSLIENTVTYGLDEALKVDSKFYRSPDRSVAARLRNSVFSAVTARNKRGERVIGIPKIAGGFAAEIASSIVWYPSRYNFLHGVKGGAISIGVNVGVNLLREFIWKK